jgi:hypothetical protein
MKLFFIIPILALCMGCSTLHLNYVEKIAPDGKVLEKQWVLEAADNSPFSNTIANLSGSLEVPGSLDVRVEGGQATDRSGQIKALKAAADALAKAAAAVSVP